MRIITYADPFALRENQDIWKLITKHPHYCATDTLVQGLIKYYGRENFGIIRPIQDLIDVYMAGYSDNPVNDMQIFLSVTNCIRKWEDGPMKQAFLFNKTKIVEAVRLLLPLKIDLEKMNYDLITQEQQKLLEIYREVRNSECCNALLNIRKKTEISFQEDIRKTAAREISWGIKYLAKNDQNGLERLMKQGIDPHFRKVGDALIAGKALIDYYDDMYREEMVATMTAAVKSCELKNPEYYKTIIINGVHRFTPELVFLVKELKRLKVEVVFLIPYASHLPSVYDTWRKVYEWTNIDFENVHDLGEPKRTDAIQMVEVLSGKTISQKEPKWLLAYDNLTAFALHEVSKIYESAKRRASDSRSRLDKMKTQFYAVKSKSCNELLKMFYPEQFESKPFLSYPIGQLILGIYKMWDFDRSALKLDVDTLAECAVSGLFQEDVNIGDVLRKMKLYFRGADSLLEYKLRINTVRKFIEKANNTERFAGLKKLSFFNVSEEELTGLDHFLDQMNDIAVRLFAGDTKEQINYIDHFNKLMNMISEAANSDNRILPEAERELINGIREQLNTSKRISVNGMVEDVADALAFFLSNRIDSDSSNWIVRDFEQIDGAVLLSMQSKAETYHFSMLSNEHMLKQSADELPWPLTVDLFDAYEELHPEIMAIANSIRERRNFLKFSLFYGTYFSEKEIQFSFIREEDGEEQTPYYLFSAMGYKPKNVELGPEAVFKLAADEITQDSAKAFPHDEEGKMLFSICPYKYLMNKVLGADINYYSEYHVTYFLRYYLTYIARDPKYKRDNTHDMIQAVIDDIKVFFPFLGATTFDDLVRDAGRDLDSYRTFNSIIHPRKINFLVAGWRMEDWKPNFAIEKIDKAMQIYMSNDTLYPDEKSLPKYTICEYCNYEGICLRDFYMEHAIETTGSAEETT